MYVYIYIYMYIYIKMYKYIIYIYIYCNVLDHKNLAEIGFTAWVVGKVTDESCIKS